jgi:hypothetical protein
MIWAPLRYVSLRTIHCKEGDVRSLGKSHPEDEDELEGVVEGYCGQLRLFSVGCEYIRNQ